MTLYDFCEYPAVRYKILFSLLDTPYNDEKLSDLRKEFLQSDIVEEMYQLQWDNGGWGNFKSKDYSVKAKIPTSTTGIKRCLYIGLTIDDRDILFMANEYLLSLLDGTSSERLFEKNERALPWQNAEVCNLIEAIRSGSSECDDTYDQWLQEQRNEDGLWDWGPQVKDPWGYFGYFSCNKHYKHNRVVDCTMEILSFLKQYIEHNPVA